MQVALSRMTSRQEGAEACPLPPAVSPSPPVPHLPTTQPVGVVQHSPGSQLCLSAVQNNAFRLPALSPGVGGSVGGAGGRAIPAGGRRSLLTSAGTQSLSLPFSPWHCPLACLKSWWILWR